MYSQKQNFQNKSARAFTFDVGMQPNFQRIDTTLPGLSPEGASCIFITTLPTFFLVTVNAYQAIEPYQRAVAARKNRFHSCPRVPLLSSKIGCGEDFQF